MGLIITAYTAHQIQTLTYVTAVFGLTYETYYSDMSCIYVQQPNFTNKHNVSGNYFSIMHFLKVLLHSNRTGFGVSDTQIVNHSYSITMNAKLSVLFGFCDDDAYTPIHCT